MGYVVNTRCLIDVQSAHDYHYGSMPHAYSHDDVSTYEVAYVQSSTVGRSSDSGWSRQTTAYPLGGGSVTGTSYIDLDALAFPSCDPAESFLDGVAVAWGFGAALVMVACLKLMSKGAR